MVKIRNQTGQCCHPDCPEPVPEDKILCRRHQALSECDAKFILVVEHEFYGENWPPKQQPKYEASDS